ncbi:hypothetical protein H2918_001077 [Escherichia coli]|nr:hypothetical protein [Escherichia coli]HBC0645847.1 hypothetical protein [Escherichia coli]
MTNNDTTLQLSSVLNRECTRSRVHCQSKKRALEIISELAAKRLADKTICRRLRAAQSDEELYQIITDTEGTPDEA